VIEGGAGWMNINVVSFNIDSNSYIIALVRPVVDGRTLGLFTSNANEVAFLASNNITTVFTPLLGPGRDGYNTGNTLYGLLRSSSGIA
jgi:hypothetical protein